MGIGTQDLRRYALLHSFESRISGGISVRFLTRFHFANLLHTGKHKMIAKLRHKQANTLPPSPLRVSQSRFDGPMAALVKNALQRRALRARASTECGTSA